jgi:hypothetical protein
MWIKSVPFFKGHFRLSDLSHKPSCPALKAVPGLFPRSRFLLRTFRLRKEEKESGKIGGKETAFDV